MRAVMTGTPELMPVIHATDSQVRVSRAKTAFTHVSTPRTLPVGMTTKQVRVVIRAYPFVAAQHTVSVTLLTLIGLQVNRLFSGAVVIEAVFAMPGAGSLVAYSAINKDFPVVQGVVLVLVIIVIVVNLAVDIFNALLDPRLRG